MGDLAGERPGSFLLGVLMVFVLDVWPPHRYVRPFLGVGVLGGYTTFSTYMLDTRACWRRGAGDAFSYLFGTLLAGWPRCGRVVLARGRWPSPYAAGRHQRDAGPTDRPAEPEDERHPRPRPAQHEELTMTLRGPATRLTVLVKESDQWQHRPLYTEIVHRAHQAGLAGASVFRGIEGYGRSSHIHTTRILSLAEDLPCSIVIVDTDEKVRAFLPELDELVAGGLVMIDAVEVVRDAGRSPDGPGGRPS